MKLKALATAVAGTVLSFSVHAQSATENPPALDQMIQSGSVEIVERFETPKESITGYVIKQANGQHNIIYGVDDYVMAGVLVDPQGVNLTAQYGKTKVPATDYSVVANNLAENQFIVSEGAEDAPEIYVFSDANCGYCKRFYDMSREFVEQGDVRINWLMVSFLHETSDSIASAIMSGGIDVLADAKTSTRSAAPKADSIPQAHLDEINSNNEAMKAVGIGGTPGFMFKKDGAWVSQSGMPKPESFKAMLDVIE